MAETHALPNERGWEDSKTVITAGSQNVYEAAWYLTSSRIWPLVKSTTWGPIFLGIILSFVIIASVVLSPSTESHFIYTDF